jgi:hypothetical protein
MGAVWAAHDTLLGRDVALKEIYLPDDVAGPDDPSIRRALREAQAAARLRHRGIVTVHDVVTDDGRPWIVMELIDGPSLAAAVREHGTLPEHRAADIGLQVLDALRAAHRQGVLHRDVKPANILLGDDRVVLTDFGIAAIDDATSITSTGQMIGSPAFLAPERLDGRPATAATDLWALGVTLYTAVTGRPPFPGDDLPSTLAAIVSRSPEPPHGADLLWPVIDGLLAKDPERRLTADQAHTLLSAIVREQQPAVTGRDPVARPFSGPPAIHPGHPASGAAPSATAASPEASPPGPAPVPTHPADRTVPAPADQATVHAHPAHPTAWGTGPTQHGWGTLPAQPGWGNGVHPAPPRPFPWRRVWIAVLVASTLIAAGSIIRATWLQLDDSANRAGGTDPRQGSSSSPGPSASSRSGTSRAIPAAFIGEWSGTARQPLGRITSWEVTITFTETSPTGTFAASLGCTGSLTVVDPAPTGREIRLRQQTGWNPRQTCVETAEITLRVDGDDKLTMEWQDLGATTNQATASLTRS